MNAIERQQLLHQLQVYRQKRVVIEHKIAEGQRIGQGIIPHLMTEMSTVDTLINDLQSQLAGIPPIPGPMNAERVRQQAREAYERQDWPQATDLLRCLIKQQPQDTLAHQQLAEANRQLGLQILYNAIQDLRSEDECEAGIDAWNDLMAQQPDYPDSLDLRSWVYTCMWRSEQIAQAYRLHDHGRYQEAIEVLYTILARCPHYIDAVVLLGQIEEDQQAERNQQFISDAVTAFLDIIQAEAFEQAEALLEALLTKAAQQNGMGQLISDIYDKANTTIVDRGLHTKMSRVIQSALASLNEA